MTSARLWDSNDEEGFNNNRVEEMIEAKLLKSRWVGEALQSKDGLFSGPLDALKAITISDETGVCNWASVL
ncbi:unnamed protein product [Echinostoma caproni]|uniref:Ovule protein n=1 Tax=Echinostoma caproni TaxID=27848 RepID=A0A183BDK4_9TREM|nr:unnamed protein product [Echinostoma caproni]